MITEHPKRELYAAVYRPLTDAWFAAAAATPIPPPVGPASGLAAELGRVNNHVRRLMDHAFAAQPNGEAIVEVVSRLRAHVLWAGTPEPDASVDSARRAIRHKMKRNISLGLIEALLCLHSAHRFSRDELALTGAETEAVLTRSRHLYRGLAALHDDEDRRRQSFLTGVPGGLRYPEHDIDAVLSGRVRVAADRFIRSGPDSAPRLRFATPPTPPAGFTSPALGCPARRTGGTDLLWDYLMAAYRRSGMFG